MQRVDAMVDAISGGRLEFGIGSGNKAGTFNGDHDVWRLPQKDDGLTGARIWCGYGILAHNLIRSFQLDTLATPKPRSRKRTYAYLIRSMRTLLSGDPGFDARNVVTVPVSLPKVKYEATTTKPENVNLSVRGGPGGTCEVYWGVTRINQKDLLDRAVKKLEDQIKKVGGVQNINEENMPEAHIRGDVNTRYKCIGAAIITMQQAGFQRVGFISEPPPLAGFRAE